MLITAPAGTPAFWRARIALTGSRWEVHDSTICSVAQRFLTRASAVGKPFVLQKVGASCARQQRPPFLIARHPKRLSNCRPPRIGSIRAATMRGGC